MKTRLFFLFSATVLFLSLFAYKSYAAQTCLSCPDKAVYGSGAITNNNGLDPSLPTSTYPKICTYFFQGQPYYFAPNSQTCNNSSQTCDAKAGCVASNAPPPSQCAKSGSTCTSDSDCSGTACSGYHCILGGYIIPPGAPANSGATCKYMPNAQAAPPPGGNSGGSSGLKVGGPSLLDIGNFLSSNPPGNAPNGNINFLYKVISVGLNILIIAAILLCLFYFIWGGFDWIMSQGDKQKLNMARQKIIFAIIGLIVVFLSFLVINILYGFFFGSGGGGGAGPRLQ